MADTTTKSIAARVPMDVYVKIITEAAERRQTVSDYVIMRLFPTGGNTGQNMADNTTEKDKMIASLQKQVKELQNAQKSVVPTTDSKELVKAQKEVEKLNQKVAEQLTSIRSKNGLVVSKDQTINDLTGQLKKANAKIDSLESGVKSNDILRKSEATMNTSYLRKIEKLDKEIILLRSNVDSLTKDVTRSKKLVEEKEALLSEIKKINESVKKELKDYNKRNSTFLGGDPIGEEFMSKISGLLTNNF